MLGLGLALTTQRGRLLTGGATPPPWEGASAYADIPTALAAVDDGAYFLEPAGDYHFAYERSGSAAVFRAPYASSAEAQASEAGIATARAAYTAAGAPTDGNLMLTATATRYGGRLVQNVNAGAAPTLNALAFLFPRDEEGNILPARTVSGTTDPLGGGQAVRLSFGSDVSELELVNVADHTWSGDFAVYMSVQARVESGADTIEYGSRYSADVTVATLTGTWQEVTATDPSINTNARNLVFSLDRGQTPPAEIDVYGFQCHVHSGPVVLPSLADELASSAAGHAPAAWGIPGAILNDADGWVTPGAAPQVALMPLHRPTLDDYTLSVWVDFSKADYSANRVSALSFANTPDTDTTELLGFGDLGMTAAGGTYGTPYMEPDLSGTVGRVASYVLGQGPVMLTARVTRVDAATVQVTHFINAVPVHENSNAFAAFEPEFILMGGNDLDRSRYQDALGQVMEDPDRWGDAFFAPRALSDAEVSGLYEGGRGSLNVTGDKMLVMGSFDSLTAFSPAPFWRAMEDASLRPGTHGMLDAIGGSRHGGGADLGGSGNDYNGPERQGLRRRALDAASQHYDAVFWLCMFGTNDLVGGVMDPILGLGWEAGRDVMDGMIARDIASATTSATIQPVLMTIPARGDWYDDWIADGSPSTIAGATTNGSTREVARQLYNADCRANHVARGYPYLLDFDAYAPTGFASMQAVASDALANGDNAYYLSDGIHWSQTGGAELAATVLVPFLAARLAAI